MDYPQNLSAKDHHWFDLIQQCRASGKSDHQWLQEHNIKAPTFYYHLNKLRKRSCDIPGSNHTGRTDIQEVVPLFVKEPEDATSMPVPINTDNVAVSVRLNIKGVFVEIANHATQEVIKNTLTALQFLC